MRSLLLLSAGALFLAAIVWPALALILTSIQQGHPPREGFLFSFSQLALLGRTLTLAAIAAITCLPLAVAAGVLACSRVRSPLAVAVLAAGLMCPPMVYAFGWLRFFPTGIAAEIRCIAAWVLWAWPVAALIIAAGWVRAAREPFLAATLSAPPLTAFLRVGLPAIRPFVFLAGMLLFVLFLGDYGVPHAFGLRVFSTELLGWATASNKTIDVLWPALLPVAVTVVALAGVLIAMRRCELHESERTAGMDGRRRWRTAVLIFMAAGWLLPLIALSRPLTSRVFNETLRTYWLDLLSSVAVATVAAFLIIVAGIGSTALAYSRKSILFTALLFGALPGAVIGQAFIAAYNRPPFEWFYDHWPILSLAYVARYAWIGVLVCGFAETSKAGAAAEQARIDGATEFQVVRFILWPQHAPLLLGGAAIIVALAVGDVTASALVRVPGYSPIALLLLDKFHQFQDGMLISLSLILVGIAALSAGLIAWASKRSLSGA